MTLVTVAAWGAKFSTHSSWNELTSATRSESGPASRAASVRARSGKPLPEMLPQSQASAPAAWAIAQVSTVVVLLPFVPVIARIGASAISNANSTSLQTGRPARCMSRIAGCCLGKPGLTTSRSKSSGSRRPCQPVTTGTPSASSRSTAARTAGLSFGFSSSAVGLAPRVSAALATACPLTPVPATAIRCPASFALTWPPSR